MRDLSDKNSEMIDKISSSLEKIADQAQPQKQETSILYIVFESVKVFLLLLGVVFLILGFLELRSQTQLMQLGQETELRKITEAQNQVTQQTSLAKTTKKLVTEATTRILATVKNVNRSLNNATEFLTLPA